MARRCSTEATVFYSPLPRWGRARVRVKILSYFLLKPGNPGFNSSSCFGTITTARQVVGQLIITEYVANPIAEVILQRRYMMAIRIIGHIAQAISQLLKVLGNAAVVAKEAFISTGIRQNSRRIFAGSNCHRRRPP
jgi:hypothetical protein